MQKARSNYFQVSGTADNVRPVAEYSTDWNVLSAQSS